MAGRRQASVSQGDLTIQGQIFIQELLSHFPRVFPRHVIVPFLGVKTRSSLPSLFPYSYFRRDSVITLALAL